MLVFVKKDNATKNAEEEHSNTNLPSKILRSILLLTYWQTSCESRQCGQKPEESEILPLFGSSIRRFHRCFLLHTAEPDEPRVFYFNSQNCRTMAATTRRQERGVIPCSKSSAVSRNDCRLCKFAQVTLKITKGHVTATTENNGRGVHAPSAAGPCFFVWQRSNTKVCFNPKQKKAELIPKTDITKYKGRLPRNRIA